MTENMSNTNTTSNDESIINNFKEKLMYFKADTITTSNTPFYQINDNYTIDNSLKIPLKKKHKQFLENNNIPYVLKDIYNVIGIDIELKINDITFMSLGEILEKNIYDKFVYIGYSYDGMGWINMIAIDKNNGLIFRRMDGGSNGYDREHNHNSNLIYNPSDDNELHKYLSIYLCNSLIQ